MINADMCKYYSDAAGRKNGKACLIDPEHPCRCWPWYYDTECEKYETNNIQKQKSMDLVDFVENILGIRLFKYQKGILNIMQKTPEELKTLHSRSLPARYNFGWLYKKLWQQYQETGTYGLDLNDNSESFKREYECIWETNEDNNTDTN